MTLVLTTAPCWSSTASSLRLLFACTNYSALLVVIFSLLYITFLNLSRDATAFVIINCIFCTNCIVTKVIADLGLSTNLLTTSSIFPLSAYYYYHHCPTDASLSSLAHSNGWLCSHWLIQMAGFLLLAHSNSCFSLIGSFEWLPWNQHLLLICMTD